MFNIGLWELVIVSLMLLPGIIGIGLLLYFVTRSSKGGPNADQEASKKNP